MKNLLIIAFVLTGLSVKAQKFTFDKAAIIYRAEGQNTINEEFAIIEKVLPADKMYYDRYVIKGGVTYYRPGLSIFKKPKTYIVINDDLIRLRTES